MDEILKALEAAGGILKALKTLGIKDSVELRTVSEGRIAVYINGEYLGIWDTERKTFVD